MSEKLTVLGQFIKTARHKVVGSVDASELQDGAKIYLCALPAGIAMLAKELIKTEEGKLQLAVEVFPACTCGEDGTPEPWPKDPAARAEIVKALPFTLVTRVVMEALKTIGQEEPEDAKKPSSGETISVSPSASLSSWGGQ